MSGYIKADVLLDIFKALKWYASYSIVHGVPTVDVVEVVRCKDCKYHLHSNEKCELIDTRLHFYETDNTWAEDAFCAWGERREE